MNTKTVTISILTIAVAAGIIYTFTKNNSFDAGTTLPATSQNTTTGTTQTTAQTGTDVQTFETDPANPNVPTKPVSPSFPQTGFKK